MVQTKTKLNCLIKCLLVPLGMLELDNVSGAFELLIVPDSKPRNCKRVPSNLVGRFILGSLEMPWVSTACCCEDARATSNCWTRSSYCCTRRVKPSSCYRFSIVTCCRSPSRWWFSCSSAMNLPFKHSSSDRTNWCASRLMEAIKVLGDFGKRRILVQTVSTQTREKGVVEEEEWIYLLL